MLDDVLAIPDHLRDALWRVESARLPRGESAGLLVCGMGGSAVGGDLAAAALGERLTAPLLTVRGYSPPSWLTDEWTRALLQLLGRDRGDARLLRRRRASSARAASSPAPAASLTERARAAGDPVIGLPGLLPAPRTAVAYMLVCALEVAAAAGIAPRLAGEIEAAAAFLEGEREELRHRAGEVAGAIGDRLPVIYGAGPTAAAARRWKTQVNENAKLPAFCSELPEANHNEICAWEGEPASSLAAVLLEDRDQHPREQLRFDLTAAEVERDGGAGDPHRGGRRDAQRAPALDGHARRPRLAGARRRPRRRPAADRGDRPPQGLAD